MARSASFAKVFSPEQVPAATGRERSARSSFLMKKKLSLAVIGIGVLIGIGDADGAVQSTSTAPIGVLQESSGTDRAAVVAILAEQDRAWTAGDADAYTAMALPEVRLTNVVGAYSIGKNLLISQVRKIFSTIYKGSRSKTTLIHITMIGKDVAVVDTISELRDFAQAVDSSVVLNGATYSRLQETMVRQGGTWWVASLHNVFIRPELVPKNILSKKSQSPSRSR